MSYKIRRKRNTLPGGRKAGGSPLKDAKELGTLKVFMPKKITKESVQNSARGAEGVRERPKSRKDNLH
jgi:hypothetical protein